MPENSPSVFIAPTPPEVSSPQKFNGSAMKWIAAIVLVLIIGLLLVLVFKSRSTTKLTTTVPQRSVQPLSKPKIVLVSDKKEYKVGEGVIVAIGLSTGGQKTAGTDVVLHYDNKVLSASSSAIFKGSLYPDYPVAAVDQASGTIKISGVSAVNQSFSGEGVFGTILMQAIKPGKTAVTVDFTQGSTTDSNIVGTSSPKDLLEEVSNLEVTIK